MKGPDAAELGVSDELAGAGRRQPAGNRRGRAGEGTRGRAAAPAQPGVGDCTGRGAGRAWRWPWCFFFNAAQPLNRPQTRKQRTPAMPRPGRQSRSAGRADGTGSRQANASQAATQRGHARRRTRRSGSQAQSRRRRRSRRQSRPRAVPRPASWRPTPRMLRPTAPNDPSLRLLLAMSCREDYLAAQTTTSSPNADRALRDAIASGAAVPDDAAAPSPQGSCLRLRPTAPTARPSSPPAATSTARIWDAATGKQLQQLTGHDDTCLVGGVQPRRQDHRHRQWRPDRPHLGCGHRRRAARSSPATAAGVDSAAYSPDGKTIVTASDDRHRPHLGCSHRRGAARAHRSQRPCHLCGLQPGRQDHRHRQ